MEWIIGVVIGLAMGGAACWLVQEFRARSRTASQAADYRSALANAELEHSKAMGDLQAAHQESAAGLNAEIAALTGSLERLPLEHLETVTRLGAEHSEKVAELRANHQQELSGLNEKIVALNAQMEQIASAQQMLETAKAQFSEVAKLTAADALQSNNQQFLELAKENFGSTLETAQRELDQRHQQFQELVKPLSDQYSQLNETFQTTATSALQNNREQFLELAKENLGTTLERAQRELDQRHQQFQELVKPLSENYGKLNPQIETLNQQVGAITGETARLAGALKGDNRAVGNWGEMQLHRVVDIANMTSYCDFGEQQTAGSSQDRPDLIVNLPERRAIVVDAKASTAAYMEARQAGDDEAKAAAFGRHADALRVQIDALSRKSYGDKVAGSLDFVVMFVPGDQFLSAALNANPGLIEYAMGKRVAIATPASLIAMLWAVASGWQQHEIARNAEQIRAIGTEMHSRLVNFVKSYGTLRQRISQTVDAFNGSVGTLEGRVMVSARRMAEMGVGDVNEMAQVEPIQAGLRQLTNAPGERGQLAA